MLNLSIFAQFISTRSFLLWALVALPLSIGWAQTEITSPNGKLKATIGKDSSGHLTWALETEGQPILLPSTLGLSLNGQDLGQNAIQGTASLKEINETYPTRGVHALAKNQYREASIPFVTSKVAWTLELRCFNDGAAFRYCVPGTDERKIDGETTTWNFLADSTIWYQSSDSRDYEKPFVMSPLSQLSDKPIMLGAILKLPGTLGYAVPTEANLVGYSDMILKPDGTGKLKSLFPNDSNGWKQKGEILSPWRVTRFSRDLNGLVNSDILHNLCPPAAPELASASWIAPGRSAWHWMVSGKPKLEQQHQWVDWTHDLGFEYYMIDDGWIEWTSDGKNPWQHLKEVVDYAATKNVKIWAWVHTKAVTEAAARLAYFEKAKQIGLAGLKIDFMGPPNAEWIQWYDDTLRDAAAAQLMVDFHGCVKPTGRDRTWPNEMTREGIRGRENGKQTGLHDTTLPFTRYLQGFADFTPTDWRGSKLGGASYAHELAQAVIYTSPLLCLSGAPENYLQNEAIDVLKAIPATWDETVVLPSSEIGEVTVFARRKGKEWFLAVLNGSTQRTLDLPLTFLGPGTWSADQLGDSPEKNEAWDRKKSNVNSADILKVKLRAEGGFVARITAP